MKLTRLQMAIRTIKPHQRLPELFNDGAWWCMSYPGCGGLACTGHRTLADALLAVARFRTEIDAVVAEKEAG